MNQIEAIFRHGVFEPLGPVDLPEDERVTLKVETASKETPEQWLERVKQHHADFVAKHGYLPDSSALIAEDRTR